MEDFEEEQDYFVRQTAKMDVFATSGAEAYACFRKFVFEALARLNSEMDQLVATWLPTARLAANRRATPEQLASARELVEQYRKSQLRLSTFSEPRTGKGDALTVLFMFALEDWPEHPESEAETNIVQAIDEFSSLYIEYFGRGKELVQILKSCFNVQ